MDDPTSGLQNLALFITIFSPALALVVVGFRTYGRVSSKLFGWDDGLILVAMVRERILGKIDRFAYPNFVLVIGRRGDLCDVDVSVFLCYK
jgi:hypothetical protein